MRLFFGPVVRICLLYAKVRMPCRTARVLVELARQILKTRIINCPSFLEFGVILPLIVVNIYITSDFEREPFETLNYRDGLP